MIGSCKVELGRKKKDDKVSAEACHLSKARALPYD